jgi:DNA-binding response OmpR family regulator
VSKARILVVDDDPKTAASVRLYLEHAGYAVEAAADGRQALARALAEPAVDLVVLDRMLPHVDGLAVCRAVRERSEVPIILLTARTAEADRLLGLEQGADDYVCKPFSPRELVARVRVILRRTRSAEDEGPVVAGPLTIDPAKRCVSIAGLEVPLTPREFAILLALARSPGHVLTRDTLRDRAFGSDSDAQDRTVDAHVVKLRRKLGPGRAAWIETVFGVGYRFKQPAGDA